MTESWVIAWCEHYHENDRIEPRWCADVGEAVELSMGWQESDDHHVLAIETPDGELTVEQEREIERQVRAKWKAEREKCTAARPPITHFVDARIPSPMPELPEDWRNWGPVAECRSEGEAAKAAREWIETDLDLYGRFATVRYWITDEELTRDELNDNLVKVLVGAVDADYTQCYSEYTGYLWTNAELKVGGHDLLEELESHAGRFVHLEIGYSKDIVETGGVDQDG